MNNTKRRKPNVEIEFDMISCQFTAKSKNEYGLVVGYGYTLDEALNDYDKALRTQMVKRERLA